MSTTDIPVTVGGEIPVPTLAELIAAGVVWYERVGHETRIRRAAVAARELIAVACHEYGEYGHIRRVADAYQIIQTALATHSPAEIATAEQSLKSLPRASAPPDPDIWLDRAITDLMRARDQCRCRCPECLTAQDPPHVRYLAQMRDELRTDGDDIIWFLRATDALERWWQLTMPHLFRQGTSASEIVDLVNA